MSCLDVSRCLSKLLRLGPLSLQTLLLIDCELDSSDLASLAQASTESTLPQLKHLDLHHNRLTVSALGGLFYGSSNWNELITFDIRNNLLDSSDLAQFLTMVQTNGCLGSLQELGIDSYPPVDIVWSCLKTLSLSSCTTKVLRNIIDAIDQECFPALRHNLCREARV